MGQALYIDIRWRDPITEPVAGVGSLIIADCAKIS